MKVILVRIRQLDPGAAWNEAERRAIPFGFLGFFFAGVINVFGQGPGIGDAFLAGVCGAVGFFIGAIGFFIGLYRNKLALALIAGLLLAVLPSAITAVLLPVIGSGKVAFVPSVALGVGLYVTLLLVHQRLSGTILVTYVRQLAYDQHGTPKTSWARTVFWVLAGLGAAILFALLMKA
jgi:hypothetical protein